MRLLALVAAILLNFSLGSLYGWSVFVPPFEESLEASRATISSVYSLTFATMIVGMFVTHRLLKLAPMAVIAFVVCVVAALGFALAGYVESFAALLIGYGLLFGVACGVGYFVAMTAASTDMPIRRSVALGMNMAAFAAGGLVWPPLFALAIDWQGPHVTLLLFAGYLVAAGVAIALMLALSRAAVPHGASETGIFKDMLTDQPRVIMLMWLGFFLVAFAALMSIGHAAGIVGAYGVPAERIYLGAMITNFAYIPGALCGGLVAELITGRRVMMGVGLLTAAALFVLYAVPSAAISFVVLAVVGASFGVSASAYPVAVASYYGVTATPRVYGRVAISYGVAGLAGPWVAGALYDMEGSYGWAALLAAILALGSIVAHGALPKPVKAAA
jgi:OFA family oxalate/formate antiporter-like MFS transporter